MYISLCYELRQSASRKISRERNPSVVVSLGKERNPLLPFFFMPQEKRGHSNKSEALKSCLTHLTENNLTIQLAMLFGTRYYHSAVLQPN